MTSVFLCIKTGAVLQYYKRGALQDCETVAAVVAGGIKHTPVCRCTEGNWYFFAARITSGTGVAYIGA